MQYEMSLWLFAVILVMLFLVALESGFWLGLRKFRVKADSEKTVRGDVTLGSMLALPGLIQVNQETMVSLIRNLERTVSE